MSPRRTPSSEYRNGNETTRRDVLTGFGTLAAGGSLGIGAGRAQPSSEYADSSPTPDEEPFVDPNALETFVDDLMAGQLGETTPGATVAIVDGDDPILTKGYGVTDVETGNDVRADKTAFRVGSVGKLVTWTAVMQNVQRGTLSLDEDITAYLRDSAVEIPEAYDEPVTLRHLGTHTAGFEPGIDPEVVADTDALVPLETVLVKHRPDRIRPPGSAVSYSNYGAALAGHVVAETTGAEFEEYAQSEIFEPLDMTHSTFEQPVPRDQPGTPASGHTANGEAFVSPDDVYINMRPAGSLSATATDMARFMSAHLGDGAVSDARIFATETARQMRRVHHVRHPAVNNWRYGFYEYGAPGSGLLAHSGGTIYFSSLLVLAPEADIGIFLSFNGDADGEHLEEVVDAILDEYGLRAAPPFGQPTTRSERMERSQTVSGEYSFTLLPDTGSMQVLDVLAHVRIEATEDGRLVSTTLSGDRREWVEVEPYVFREVGGRDILAFELENGDVDVMNVSSEPQGVYEPVPLWKRQTVTGGVLAGSLATFGVSTLGWGGCSAWRRWMRSGPAGSDSQEVSP